MALGLLFLFSACSDDTKLTLSKHELTIKEGEKVQIEVSVEPEKLLNDVLWESSHEEIATVDNGLITGIKEGSAVITATLKGKKATLTVTVTKAQDVFVIFNTGGGSEIETKTLKEGSLLEKPEDPEKLGHSFSGWYVQEALITLFDFSKPITKNTTLYAGWSKEDVLVSFNTMGGNPLDDITLGYNDLLLEVDLSVTVSKEGYTFKGWFLDENLTQPVVYDVHVTEDFTVYAGWEENIYTVTFEYNNGDEATSIEIGYDNLIEIASPEKEGFEFDGWLKNDLLTIPFDITKDTVKEDLTLFAKWKYGKVSLTFIVNGGTPIATMMVTTMDVIENVPTTSRQNYIFSGWYKDSEFKDAFDFALPITENTTVYALWTYDEAVGAKVTFELNGGEFLLSSTDFFIKYGRTPIKTFKTNLVYNGNPWTEELYKNYVYINPFLNTGSYWVKTGFARN